MLKAKISNLKADINMDMSANNQSSVINPNNGDLYSESNIRTKQAK